MGASVVIGLSNDFGYGAMTLNIKTRSMTQATHIPFDDLIEHQRP